MMILKVNNEFIYLPDQPELVEQCKTADLLDSAGDFSYQFSIPNTAETRRILGIVAYDNFEVDAELVSNGHTVFAGILVVENIDIEIACSFMSGNTNWFALLGNKRISEIPIQYLERFKVPLFVVNPSPFLVATWTNTEGIAAPLVDRGRLRNLDNDLLESGDFLPMAFIKTIMIAIMNSNGLKIQGELLTDGLYNTLVAGSAVSMDTSLPYFDGLAILVGKNAQTLNTTPQKVTFTLTSFPYYVGSFDTWDSTLSRYLNIPINFQGKALIDFSFSTSVTYTIELRINGVTTDTITGTGVSVTDELNLPSPDEGDYFEIWASISSGTADILDAGSLRVTVTRLTHYYPHFLFGPMTQADFVRSVFTMFNVIPTYDKETKTVTANLFENLRHKTGVDLSQYLDRYEINTSEILADLAKDNIFQHQDNDTEEIEAFNASSEIPFGAGVFRPSSRVLNGDNTIETSFTSSKDYFNTWMRASLMDLSTMKFEISESLIDIVSVADNGSGRPLVTTAEEHNLNQLDFFTISDTSNNEYLGLGQVASIPSPTQFVIARADFGSTATGKVAATTKNVSTDSGTVYIASYFPNMLVSDFSFNSTINYGALYTRVAWAFFLKEGFGLQIDNLRKSPAFGKGENNFSLTLMDSYYDLYRRSMDKPIKVKATMNIPEVVYHNLDFSEPVILNTPEFSWKFFNPKVTGYKGSEFKCVFELIKLS